MDSDWLGKTVVCIASGPSLTVDDCKFVEESGLTTIAVNTSWERAKFCSVIYAGDSVWWVNNHHKIDIPAERWSCLRSMSGRFDVKWHSRSGPYNSGARAIELAIDRGATRIILVGYDCSIKNGLHWHGNHVGTGNPDQKKIDMWKRQFAVVAAEARTKGIDIVNCTPATELTCFRIATLESELCQN